MAKGFKVTEEEKRKMWELYQVQRSYVAVAHIMKRSPDTVSHHVREYEIAVSITNHFISNSEKTPLR